ncbi:MAG: hypothetical protein LBT02_04195 [Rickettsiales bacterium]|jgi:hypothetical protein|nr:hypothetical protein [Rickettsiales bacterium]
MTEPADETTRDLTSSDGKLKLIPFRAFLEILNEKNAKGEELTDNEIGVLNGLRGGRYRDSFQFNLFVQVGSDGAIAGAAPEIIEEKGRIDAINKEFVAKAKTVFRNVVAFAKYGEPSDGQPAADEVLEGKIVFDLRALEVFDKIVDYTFIKLLDGLDSNVLEKSEKLEEISKEVAQEMTAIKEINVNPVLRLETLKRLRNFTKTADGTTARDEGDGDDDDKDDGEMSVKKDIVSEFRLKYIQFNKGAIGVKEIINYAKKVAKNDDYSGDKDWIHQVIANIEGGRDVSVCIKALCLGGDGIDSIKPFDGIQPDKLLPRNDHRATLAARITASSSTTTITPR